MKFEEFLQNKKTPVVLDQKTGDIGGFEIKLGEETPEVIEAPSIQDAIENVDLMPMIDIENKSAHASLEMYKKIDPQFANSILAWD